MLSWKNEYEMFQKWPLCSLCEKLHTEKDQIQVYQDSYEWWYKDENGNHLCEDASERHYFHAKDDIKFMNV